ncbi:MAG: acyltransferase family protein [Anaerolineae bacterium]|nr:acyltransferase family protein [Anaerolineae bacterium]
MQSQTVSHQTDSVTREAVRLHYLDWLRVIAILGIFLIHVIVVFSEVDFHINNAEQSSSLTPFGAFFYPWGMPLVFLIAGAGSWFALQRRTPGQYARERFKRLLIPFVVGSILLSPIVYYFDWLHSTGTGVLLGSFPDFVRSRPWVPNPRVFGAVGDHLWFLAFLFCFSLLTLPLFHWLEEEKGQRFVSRMARLWEFRGGVLLFILPLLIVRLGLQPLFPQYLNWTDFISFLLFCILGYLLFADKRFTQAIRRDWPVTLTIGVAAFLAAAAISMATDEFDLELVPRTPLDWAWWTFFTACSWCWTAFMLFLGMRFLNFSNKWLHYSQEAILPFYVFHLPVIIVIAYFVVQWNVGLVPKLLVVGLGAFAVSLGLYQVIIRRAGPLRFMFGMKARQLNI